MRERAWWKCRRRRTGPQGAGSARRRARGPQEVRRPVCTRRVRRAGGRPLGPRTPSSRLVVTEVVAGINPSPFLRGIGDGDHLLPLHYLGRLPRAVFKGPDTGRKAGTGEEGGGIRARGEFIGPCIAPIGIYSRNDRKPAAPDDRGAHRSWTPRLTAAVRMSGRGAMWQFRCGGNAAEQRSTPTARRATASRRT